MNILVVLSRFPYPLTKGDKLRAFHQIKELSKNNSIYLFCLSHEKVSDNDLEMLKPYCKDICIAKLSTIASIFNIIKFFFCGKPFQVGYFFSKKAKKQLHAFKKRTNADKVYCQFVRTLEYVKDLELPVVLDFQDALSKNMERRANVSPFYLKPILKWEAFQLKRYEQKALEICNATTIISEADKNCINSKKNKSIHVIPNGVDLEYYVPQPAVKKTFDIIFTGNMSYAPNINASIYLVKEIMPLVWQQFPQTNVLIAGANPVAAITALSSSLVTIMPNVQDMRACYAASKMLVAPMQIGTGLQNKLLEAMAMEIPCISSPLSNKALMAKNNEQILIAEMPKDYAAHIIDLLNNDLLRNKMALAGRAYIVQNFSWGKYTTDLERIIAEI